MSRSRDTVLRIRQVDFVRIRGTLLANPRVEHQMFCLFSLTRTRRQDILLLKMLLFPERRDLSAQSAASVAPTAEFQALAYGLGHDLELAIIDLHTHPWCRSPRLSHIDMTHGTRNARYVAKHLGRRTTMGMVVFGRDMRGFQGLVWNRTRDRFEPIRRIEVLGSPTEILGAKRRRPGRKEARFARHHLIPGWDQARLAGLKVFLAGLGGNGSLLLQALLAIGVGTGGRRLMACDPDMVEESNLPRIPFAVPTDVGESKADVARAYAHVKAPDAHVESFRQAVQDPAMMAMAKGAHVLIGAVDADGPRKILNSLSARHLIPYIDVSSEIIPNQAGCESAGQVRVVVPGETACLMCSGAIDPTEAALDLLSEEEQAERAHHGYVRGTDRTPTPSVLHLNGVASHLAVSQLLRLVFDGGIERSAFLHYDREACQLIGATAPPDPDCPVCGRHGYLGAGDELPEPQVTDSGTSRTLRLADGQWGPPESKAPVTPPK